MPQSPAPGATVGRVSLTQYGPVAPFAHSGGTGVTGQPAASKAPLDVGHRRRSVKWTVSAVTGSPTSSSSSVARLDAQ